MITKFYFTENRTMILTCARCGKQVAEFKQDNKGYYIEPIFDDREKHECEKED